ncbi:MAG TPA: amidohydrolase family protein, partial [Chloroflexota bacterium]
SNDLRQEVKQTLLAARVRDGAEALSARDALRLGTRGGASCLGRDDIGSIEVGKAADIALFDADSLALAGSQTDLVAGIVLSAPRPIAVIVNGEFVVRDGHLERVDEDDIAHQHNAAARRLMTKASVATG